MGYLESLNEIDGGIFWFFREQDGLPGDRIKKVIEKFSGYALPIDGFDEMMIKLGNELGFERVDKKIMEIAQKRTERYREQIDKIQKSSEKDKETKAALNKIIGRSQKDWWYYIQKARIAKNINDKEKIYLEGINNIPNKSQLMDSFAVFLCNHKKDYDRAEEYYKKAIKLDPENATAYANYACFLSDFLKDYDRAEKIHLKAIELDSQNANLLANYAKQKIVFEQFEKTKALIEQAFDYNIGEHDFTLELWFYCFAIFPEEYKDAEQEIERLLNKGIRSIGWYLDNVIDVAKKRGHKNVKKLIEIANRITQPVKKSHKKK